MRVEEQTGWREQGADLNFPGIWGFGSAHLGQPPASEPELGENRKSFTIQQKSGSSLTNDIPLVQLYWKLSRLFTDNKAPAGLMHGVGRAQEALHTSHRVAIAIPESNSHCLAFVQLLTPMQIVTILRGQQFTA